MWIKLSGVVDNRSIMNVRDVILSILDDYSGIYILDLNRIENEEFPNLTNFRKMISDSIRVNQNCILLSDSKKLELWIENYSIFNGTYLVKDPNELDQLISNKVEDDLLFENVSSEEPDIRLHLDYLIQDGS
ncbi:hypothetical protein [Leptospira stimsonii]|uniref:STAS domain-containing protein n=1 Tax=Leptospira stimsonii TaxID=2202203 RepID=A0A4R9LAZ0_9LEPT|nr:hypothetical protein [Leptospira stimsonii]RHX84253.1 hypothetical protein DLM78_19210 [Leptospira stimsonii]TGK26072.1 hypothetical protein EHO98_01485 [Leptospira stimsonii]TGM22507.1 hypothetical protein EHQ90_00815 [Leptospira stimsonii]